MIRKTSTIDSGISGKRMSTAQPFPADAAAGGQAQRVDHHQQRTGRHADACQPGRHPAHQRQRHRHRVVDQRPAQVLRTTASVRRAVANTTGRSSMRSDSTIVGTGLGQRRRGAHRDRHVGAGQHRRIIDPVADHRDDTALPLNPTASSLSWGVQRERRRRCQPRGHRRDAAGLVARQQVQRNALRGRAGRCRWPHRRAQPRRTRSAAPAAGAKRHRPDDRAAPSQNLGTLHRSRRLGCTAPRAGAQTDLLEAAGRARTLACTPRPACSSRSAGSADQSAGGSACTNARDSGCEERSASGGPHPAAARPAVRRRPARSAASRRWRPAPAGPR